MGNKGIWINDILALISIAVNLCYDYQYVLLPFSSNLQQKCQIQEYCVTAKATSDSSTTDVKLIICNTVKGVHVHS
jgi:hypothetical protein